VLVLDPLAPAFDLGRLAFEQRDEFTESPLEISVPHLLARRAVMLAVGGMFAPDRATVRGILIGVVAVAAFWKSRLSAGNSSRGLR
jgi:hypothetical protein